MKQQVGGGEDVERWTVNEAELGRSLGGVWAKIARGHLDSGPRPVQGRAGPDGGGERGAKCHHADDFT